MPATGAIQNLLQMFDAVNGATSLGAKSLNPKMMGGWPAALSSKICKWFIPALHSRLATPWGP